MKKDLRDLLVCPRCQSGVELEAEAVEGAEVMEGTLRCASCEAVYPVRRGVPRGGSTPSNWYSPRFQWKHTHPEVLGWFRVAGFSDLYAGDEAICVSGVKRDVREPERAMPAAHHAVYR